MEPKLLKKKEVCAMLGIKRSALEDRMTRGLIKFIKLGDGEKAPVRFEMAAVEAYIASLSNKHNVEVQS